MVRKDRGARLFFVLGDGRGFLGLGVYGGRASRVGGGNCWMGLREG